MEFAGRIAAQRIAVALTAWTSLAAKPAKPTSPGNPAVETVCVPRPTRWKNIATWDLGKKISEPVTATTETNSRRHLGEKKRNIGYARGLCWLNFGYHLPSGKMTSANNTVQCHAVKVPSWQESNHGAHGTSLECFFAHCHEQQLVSPTRQIPPYSIGPEVPPPCLTRNGLQIFCSTRLPWVDLEASEVGGARHGKRSRSKCHRSGHVWICFV